jgi:mannose-6-phosphate isomerase-like protein (cupin superfamily)
VPKAAGRAVDRRSVLQHLAFGLVGIGQLDLLTRTGGSRAPAPPATWLDAAALRRAIRAAPEDSGEPGLYLLTLSEGAGYRVLGARRTVPARSELHADVADVWYVLQGDATLVTGGQVTEGVPTAAGETRGRGIAGGERRRIRTGDFGVIPAGVPHWVSRVARELLYLVIKVPST